MRTRVGIVGAGPAGLMHTRADGAGANLRRQIAELDAVTSTMSGSTFLAENYVGVPLV